MTELCAKTSAPFANHFSDNSRLSLSSYIPTSKMAAAAERRKKQNKKKEPLETHKTEERNKGKLLPFSHHSICLNNSNLYLFCSSSLSLCFFFFSLFLSHTLLSGCAKAKSSLEEMSEFVGGQQRDKPCSSQYQRRFRLQWEMQKGSRSRRLLRSHEGKMTWCRGKARDSETWELK